MQERPHRTPVGLDVARRQFRRQAAGGERTFGDARSQPLCTVAHQRPRLVPAGLPVVTASPDPDDNYLLAMAAAGAADFLVSLVCTERAVSRSVGITTTGPVGYGAI